MAAMKFMVLQELQSDFNFSITDNTPMKMHEYQNKGLTQRAFRNWLKRKDGEMACLGLERADCCRVFQEMHSAARTNLRTKTQFNPATG
jgi:hypothetical protein